MDNLNHNEMITALLNLGHAEYVPATLHTLDPVWWRPSEELEDLDALEDNEALRGIATSRFFETVGVEAPADWDISWQNVVLVENVPYDTFVQMFLEQEQLIDVAPSGDDDTFDYWPSGCRLALQLASIIEENGNAATAIIKARIRDTFRYLSEAGDAPGLIAAVADKIGVEL